jgi:hypothetical protein
VGEPEDDLLSDGDLLDVTVVVTDLVTTGEVDFEDEPVLDRDTVVDRVAKLVGLGLVDAELDRDGLSLDTGDAVAEIDDDPDGDPDGEGLADADALEEIVGCSTDVVAVTLGDWLAEAEFETDADVDTDGDGLDVADGDIDVDATVDEVGSGDDVVDRD